MAETFTFDFGSSPDASLRAAAAELGLLGGAGGAAARSLGDVARLDTLV